MKRILVGAVVCLLLFACGKPAAVETAGDVREAEKTVPPTVSEAKPEPAPADEPFASENSALEPEPTEETVAFAGPEQTEEPAELPPVPPEKRFPGHFSETPVLDAEGMRYTGSKVDIRIRICHETDTYAKRITYYVADIYVADVTSIRTIAAQGDFTMRYERRVKEIASDAGAILAIDGDTYTHVRNSFVIRNGVLYRDTPIENTDICILYRDGTMETKKWGTFTAQEIIDADPWQVWGFGPALLDEEGHAISIDHHLAGHNPRAAIGYFEPGHYCFVVVDGQRGGKDNGSDGIRLSAFSQLMADLGCKAAYNLDGGDSAQMYWNGAIINKSNNESRVISDIIYILPEP